jgi:hypothetical protein
MDENKIVILIIMILHLYTINAALMYPEADNIAINKQVLIHPMGSTCGLELKDSLCDNRFQDNKLCSNTSALFYCDQSCPYGNVLTDFDKIEQLKLENMNPCLIVKDYGSKLSKQDSGFSYYFDKTNNLCNNNDETVKWKPFDLINSQAKPSLSFYNTRTPGLSIADSGFTLSLWFRQFRINNGFIFNFLF